MRKRLLALALLALACPVPAPAADPKAAKASPDQAFGLDRLWHMHLTIQAKDWEKMQPTNRPAPFGGFGWLRVGYAMVDSPLAGLLPLIGVAGVTLAAALAGNIAVWVAERPSRRKLAGAAAVGIVLSGGTAFGAALPPAPANGTVNVGWVQGGAPGGGVYGLGAPRTITTNQARGTLDLAAEIMGPDWATSKTFRFGASGLYGVLADIIAGTAPAERTDGAY